MGTWFLKSISVELKELFDSALDPLFFVAEPGSYGSSFYFWNDLFIELPLLVFFIWMLVFFVELFELGGRPDDKKLEFIAGFFYT